MIMSSGLIQYKCLVLLVEIFSVLPFKKCNVHSEFAHSDFLPLLLTEDKGAAKYLDKSQLLVRGCSERKTRENIPFCPSLLAPRLKQHTVCCFSV